MANIPVEPTRTGVPWWTWLLGLLALLLLVFLFSQCGDDDVVVEENTVVSEAVTTPAALDLSDVYVTRVVGDNTFFVASTPGGTNETLVYLDEEATPGSPTEGRYDVTEGQHLSITGTRMPVGATDLGAWGLTPEQVALVGDEYVQASSLTVLDDASELEDAAGSDAAGGDAPESGDASMEDAAAGGELTSLSALDAAIDGSTAAGRTVRLASVPVTALAGDSTFYVGTGNDRVLVVLENMGESESGSGAGEDGAFDVNVGDRVTFTGEVMTFRRGMRGTSALPAAERATAERRQHVVVVDSRGSFSKQ